MHGRHEAKQARSNMAKILTLRLLSMRIDKAYRCSEDLDI